MMVCVVDCVTYCLEHEICVNVLNSKFLLDRFATAWPVFLPAVAQLVIQDRIFEVRDETGTTRRDGCIANLLHFTDKIKRLPDPDVFLLGKASHKNADCPGFLENLQWFLGISRGASRA